MKFCNILGLVACWLGLGSPGRAADWPHWRGPNRNGIVTETSGWTGGAWPGPLAWTTSVGQGSTSPLVVGGKVYVLGWENEHDVLRCLDLKTGKPVWRQAYRCPLYGRHHLGDESVYSGPTSTPEYDPETGLLFTLSIDGDLHCWDPARGGALLWHVNLYQRYGVKRRPRVGQSGHRDYGYTTAPFAHRGSVIVEAGASAGNLVAFDQRTGRQLWTSQNRDPAGHAGGMSPIKVDGSPGLAVFTHRHLLVVRLDAGREGQTLAEYPWITDFANSIATPAVHDDCVVITSDYNHKAICKLRIEPGRASRLWQQPFSSKVCSPIIAGDRIYWAWQRARCLDLRTGEQVWEGGQFGDPASCILTADDRLIIWGHRGKLVLAETDRRSPGKYRELAVQHRVFQSEAWPHVVLADGGLLCKDRQGNVKCFRLGGP